MSWFTRKKKGITTSTEEKKETPGGLWYKCPSCKKLTPSNEHIQNMFVCTGCDYHEKIGSAEYFNIIFENYICFRCIRKSNSGNHFKHFF